MLCFKNDGKEYVPPNNPREITLQEALKEIESLPSDEEFKDNFIGFINEKDETIQFVRNRKDSWLMDVPIVVKGRYGESLIKKGLTTEQVKRIVTKFFLREDWKTVFDFGRHSDRVLGDASKKPN